MNVSTFMNIMEWSLAKILSLICYFLTCPIFFLEDDVGDLVDVKGSHEDIYNFARKADIVVCCLRLNCETV